VSIPQFDIELSARRMIAPRVLELSFKRADGAPFTWVAGQFITLLLPHEGKDLRRSYSIATVPGSEGGGFSFAISHVEGGRATNILFAATAGQRFKCSGPFGRFILRDDPPSRLLLLATGTGVTPYRAMLPELAARIAAGRCEVDLLLGVRSRAELLYGEDFSALAAREPRFRFHPCYSRELPAAPAATERKGYVQDVLKEFPLDAARDIAYVCGNPGMIDAVHAQLTAAGFPIGNQRREKYVSSN
jgi:ferredoxin-NADP reductase